MQKTTIHRKYREQYVVAVGTHSAELLLYTMSEYNVHTNAAELGHLGNMYGK